MPDAIETDLVASGIADAIWTLDGEPWDSIAIGGSCGPATCTLEVVGSRADADDVDLWTFAASPSGDAVEIASSDLGAIPAALRADLDRLGRRLADPKPIAELVLASARWLPPPDESTFLLAYRSGNEEGSCRLDLAIDVVAQRVTSQRATDC